MLRETLRRHVQDSFEWVLYECSKTTTVAHDSDREKQSNPLSFFDQF